MTMSDMQTKALALRLARDDDAQDLYGLLSLCFAEYPGCFIDPHDDLPDLLRAGSAFPSPGGFWVMEDERGRVCACVALDFPEGGVAELHRLYVRPDQRSRGLGRALTETVEARARAAGAVSIRLFSDTRFATAHRLYLRLGYEQSRETRPLGDISNSLEYRFGKLL